MLRVWLPLNGTLDNLGTDNVEITSRSLEYTRGKVTAKSAKFNGDSNQYIHIGKTGDYQFSEFTWSLWIKCTGLTNWYQTIMSNGRDYMKYGFNLKISLGGCVYIDTESSRSEFGDPIQLNTWYHIAVTEKDNVIKIYINGELDRTITRTVAPDYTYSQGLTLGKLSWEYQFTTEYYPFNGQINDVRVYDNALSAKEVKELSKGLSLHYPLNDVYNTVAINKYKGDEFEGKCGRYISDIGTVNKLQNERGYNYHIDYTGTGTNSWAFIQFQNFPFELGKTYVYSLKIRCHTIGVGLWFRAARSVNDWGSASVRITTKADDEWHEYCLIQTLPTESTFLRLPSDDAKVEVCPMVELVSDAMLEKDHEFVLDFDIKDVMVCECNNSGVPINSDDFNYKAVVDLSGYGNNGGIQGSLQYTTDTPRYNGCMYFKNLNYIQGQTPWADGKAVDLDAFTINVWIRQYPYGNGPYATYFSSYGMGNPGLWLGINVEKCGQWSFRGNHSPNYAEAPGLLTENTWYMFTYVFRNNSVLWYRDGGYQSGMTYEGDGTITWGSTFTLGNFYTPGTWDTSFCGYLSDFRIYSTALSADDIKELYETSASLCDNGTLITQGEFVEKGV